MVWLNVTRYNSSWLQWRETQGQMWDQQQNHIDSLSQFGTWLTAATSLSTLCDAQIPREASAKSISPVGTQDALGIQILLPAERGISLCSNEHCEMILPNGGTS